jgi:amino acid adenylation domain-containing protein
VKKKLTKDYLIRAEMAKNDLSPAKRALLDKWMKGQINDINSSIPARPKDEQPALSFPQQRQLFLELLDRGTAVNNLFAFLELSGKLDLEALEKSANRILERHEVLRTKYHFGRGMPEIEILPHFTFKLPVIDLRKIELDKQRTEAQKLAEKVVLKPFNLTRAPLIHLNLFVLSNDVKLLLLIVHHTIADGWSLGVFLRELMFYYRSITSGSVNDLPELPIQYADFAHWQTDLKRETVWKDSMKYWKEQLHGELPVLELPIDFPRSSRQTFSGRTHHFSLSSELIRSLEQFNRKEDVTLFMTLLTVFYILLHRFSGQDDILVGTPVANRNVPELEDLIGVFINTLVLRTNLSEDPGFRALLLQVRKVCLDAYAHQDLPFEKLVEELKPQRDLSRTPLFQVVFNLQNAPMPKLDIPGINTRFLELDRGVSQFDLTLMLTKSGEEFNASVDYNSDLFEPATIARMFNAYQLLLQEAIKYPDMPISRLQIIDKEERFRLVNKINRTQADYPRDKCFHQLFELQVEKTPGDVAVVFNQNGLTYLELNRRANAWAGYLKKLGVTPGTVVAILMERSLELLEVIIGVLKSGGIYVPIHTSFPTERIQYILKDAGVKILISNIKSELNTNNLVRVVNLNNGIVLSDGESSIPAIQITSEDLAYIMYTSGSTGNPKGVMVQHYALINFLLSMQERPGIRSDDILLAVTSLSFDIAALELFLPLITGATVLLASEEMIHNPLLIDKAINDHQVSVMQATPAMWQLLVDIGWKGRPELKALCGGDVLTRNLADQLLDKVGSLWNMYGPTETTIWSSVSQIKSKNTPITIGEPIHNTQMYILDRNLQPVPIGVVGELHIGGDGLAKGYLNQPHLTDEKFIPDEFNSNHGARLYKTGDLARFLPDHSIEILGRMDDQVKIVGHRIELGEIETLLSQHPMINQSIIIARTESSGDKRIVAYYVPQGETSPEENELRDFMSRKLPSYMLPTFFVPLSSIPLTPNGKIDRKSLPVPKDLRSMPGYVAPTNEEEKLMVKIWQEALEIEQVGIHDNFFELGGASIQSLQIVAKANMLGLRFNVEAIFEYQTVAALVAHLQK